MSTIQEEGSFASLGSGKWAQRVVNGTDDGEVGGGGGASTADGAPFTPDTTAGTIAMGVYEATPSTVTTGEAAAIGLDNKRNVKVTLATLLAGEDLVNGVMKTEQQFTATRVTADGQIKASAGFVHTITIAPTTATPTAGLLTVYNSLTETGTIIYSEWVFATTIGHTVTINAAVSTGIYVGYDATLANASCTVAWR